MAANFCTKRTATGRRTSMGRSIMGYIATALAVYVLLVGALYVTQRSLLYHPDRTVPDPADFGVPEMQVVRVPTPDGFELLCWWRAPRDDAQPVIAVFHGNAGHIGSRAHKMRDYLDTGYGVLLMSYRYNAGTGGSPSEANLFDDARAALDFLNREGIADNRIVPYGESLGTGVAVAMAAERRLGALVLEAPYSSMPDLAQHHYWYAPARWLVRDRFDSMSRIGRVDEPVIVVHGLEDRVVPPQFGRRLYDAAREPKEAHFLPDGNHNNLPDLGLARLTIDFLERHLRQ